jgi:signal transduction histidine kinase/CheY-like chemotaxis protein
MVAIYPLGLLMAVVYSAFGGWIGLLLLVLPVIAAYAAIEHARRLREANEELRTAHAQLTASKDDVLSINQRLRQALADLEAAQAQIVEQERLRALGQMASGIAHDFNNALAPVVGFSELLLLQPERWKDEAFMRRTLQMVNTAGQDAAQVVRQLREFYRKPEAGEVLLPLDLNALARQSVDLTEPRWRGQALAAGATITMTTQLATLPPVLGDEAALREALTNLIFNAVDAMPQGGKIVIRSATRGDEVLLEVIDEGTGMTEEVRRRCLDPFFTTKGVNGTGMGLSMVHGIARRHGGALEIESAWGRGTTMRLVLPGCESQQPGAAEGAPEGAETAMPERRPLRVLVVDDEPAVRQVLAAYVSSYGYTAETATNGHEGLLRFREAYGGGSGSGGGAEAEQRGGFDVVLTDRAMPEMNGDHLARAIKQIDASVPVVMLTGFGDMLNALEERPGGVDEVLGKPVSLDALRATLRRLTDTSGSEAAAQTSITTN